MRSRGIDTVIDMEFFSRASAIFAFLSGATTRVGLHRFTGELPYRGNLMTHRVQYLPHVHIAQQYALLVEAAFLEPVDEPLLKFPLQQVQRLAGSGHRFTPRLTSCAACGARLRHLRRRRPRPIVLVNPNASDLLPLRKWDERALHRVVQAHPRRAIRMRRIAVTGAPSERAAADRLCRAIGAERAVSFAGQTTLRELLTLYTIADVLVTNDSGPAHFASLTPVHTVVLFGPETPRLFGSLAPATDRSSGRNWPAAHASACSITACRRAATTSACSRSPWMRYGRRSQPQSRPVVRHRPISAKPRAEFRRSASRTAHRLSPGSRCRRNARWRPASATGDMAKRLAHCFRPACPVPGSL